MNTREVYERAFKEVGQYYVLVRKDGIFVVDGPEVSRRRKDETQEAMLCLFMVAADANMYRETFTDDVSVRKVTLTGLWSMLESINNNTMNRFKVPVCVHICTASEGGHAHPILELHSTYQLQS